MVGWVVVQSLTLNCVLNRPPASQRFWLIYCPYRVVGKRIHFGTMVGKVVVQSLTLNCVLNRPPTSQRFG